MWNNQNVQVLFPAYNEEENIKNAINEFLGNIYVDDVIVIDNNSKDDTKTEIQKTNAIYIFEQVAGYGAALSRGLRESTAEIVITCEPDGTFSSNDIIKLLVYSDDHDIVFGSRTSKTCIRDGATMGWFLRIGNIVVAKLLEYLFKGPRLSDVGCSMKLIKKKKLDKIKHQFKVTKSHFQPEFMINSLLIDDNVLEIPVNYYPRIGTSKITGSPIKAFLLGNMMVYYIITTRIIRLFR